MDKETRSFKFELETREDEDGNSKIRGHAAVFNEEADIWGFREKVAPGAFKDSIKVDDVRALFNHDPNFVLGRNTAGTLTLKEDKQGLAIEIDPPDTQFARDLQVSIRRGDISQMSFGFNVLEEEWKDGGDDPDLRTLNKVRLFDVSPVTFPAYEGTDVAVRSHEEWQKQNKPKPWKSKILRKRLNQMKEEK